jgi:Arc/MetJ-type ribon-helix-helix transcriptional regulator
MAKDRFSVSLTEELFKKIEEIIKDTEFKSVADYVTKAVEEKIAKEPPKESLSEEDEEKVKERLKALGYMD